MDDSNYVSLYVGDLHPDVNNEQLTQAFNEFKTLTSVHICRDYVNAKSLGYAFLNFVSPQDAKDAMELKNNMKLNGKAIRVTWSLRDSDARKNVAGNVFVKNLDKSIDNTKLEEIFSKIGEVSSGKIPTTEDGKSKGYGYVQFTSEESANVAINTLTGTIIAGKKIHVSQYIKKADRVSNNSNLYFKNVDLKITQEVLQEKFAKFGNILSMVLYMDDKGGSKGFGFVNFENPNQAKQAMEAMHGLQLGSKILYVAKAQKKAEREKFLRTQFEKKKEKIAPYMESNLYIKNISDEVNEEALIELFSTCGTITSAKIMHTEKGISKGFGFVCFSASYEAQLALRYFHRYMFHGKPLYVAIAQRKEDRKSQLQQRFQQNSKRVPCTMVQKGYPCYYTPSVVSPQGFFYQPLEMNQMWQNNGFASTCHHQPLEMNQMWQNDGFTSTCHHQPIQTPLVNPQLPNNTRPKTQNRVKSNVNAVQDKKVHTPYDSLAKDSTNHQGTYKTPNKEYKVKEYIKNMLAAADPCQDHKRIVGDYIFPLVSKQKPELAGKITGMLLEMDNTELLAIVESNESLKTKVEEAVQVLKQSNAHILDKMYHSNFLTAELPVK